MSEEWKISDKWLSDNELYLISVENDLHILQLEIDKTPKTSKKYRKLVEKQLELSKEKKELLEEIVDEKKIEIYVNEFNMRSKRADEVLAPLVDKIDIQLQEYEKRIDQLDEDSDEMKEYTELLKRKATLLNIGQLYMQGK